MKRILLYAIKRKNPADFLSAGFYTENHKKKTVSYVRIRCR